MNNNTAQDEKPHWIRKNNEVIRIFYTTEDKIGKYLNVTPPNSLLNEYKCLESIFLPLLWRTDFKIRCKQKMNIKINIMFGTKISTFIMKTEL